MKLLFQTRTLLTLLGFFAPVSGGATEEILQTPPPPSSGQLVSTAYLAMVRDSIVRIDPRRIASAALSAMATTSRPTHALPESFGHDPVPDAAWLADLVPVTPRPWPVIDAMTRAAATAHLWLVTPQRRAGMMGLGSGKRISTSGFSVYPLEDGRLVVTDVIPGASADLSGLRSGDIILRLNGVAVMCQLPLQMVALAENEQVALEIERTHRPETVTLRTNKIEMSSVSSRLHEGGMGYVRLRWFARSTDQEQDTPTLARRAFATLAALGARGLVVDLRSALGGSGEVAIASALSDGEIIYILQQPITTAPRPIKRDGARIWPDRPIVILVNELTVSAGEALALSLRELAHARILGRTSGGGLTEFTSIPLADGHAITIPTGVVLGPISARDQPDHAIQPDLEIANPTVEELLAGRDRQLDAALAILNRG